MLQNGSYITTAAAAVVGGKGDVCCVDSFRQELIVSTFRLETFKEKA